LVTMLKISGARMSPVTRPCHAGNGSLKTACWYGTTVCQSPKWEMMHNILGPML